MAPSVVPNSPGMVEREAGDPQRPVLSHPSSLQGDLEEVAPPSPNTSAEFKP